MWSLAEICALAADALRAEAARLDEEQSPYGVDARDEVALHAVLRAGFERAGLGALAEQRYPASRFRPRRSEGERCDIVLTPAPGQTLIDPLLADTLFANEGVDPAAALWLEVKTAHQFALIDGVAGPSPRYAAQLLTEATADVRKISRETGARFAAVLLILFTERDDIARHDLEAWLSRCLDRRLPVESPVAERFPIADRLGNGVCTIALTRVRPMAEN